MKVSEVKYGQVKEIAEQKAVELQKLQIEYDNKRQFDRVDERDSDRKLAHELKEDPIDCEKEEKYKKLSLASQKEVM